MNLTNRLMRLILDAQTKAEALEQEAARMRQATADAQSEEQWAKMELQAARERLATSRLTLERARQERDRHLADMREECQRLGIEAPDAS